MNSGFRILYSSWDVAAWFEFWRMQRYHLWGSISISNSNLRLPEQTKDKLAHYAKEGAGSSDVEYRFPFADPGFGELEGIAHRTDVELRKQWNVQFDVNQTIGKRYARMDEAGSPFCFKVDTHTLRM